ncbi:hypothetical protein JMN32_13930 [Fulvivirga sp. 29W222]|uniref:Uncharacterized protein n=1 Tax=Fulvivirga marina TaxID=2494733 RepID=A0A937FYM3_9BACT|nr:hypothetical protein [Fulvivirga marina]MBL6447412.1 hypothetical protein [Fulvivirga marina]
MIEAKIYRGIEYVRISELPEDQKTSIKNWVNMDVVIKIQTETVLMSDCILFKDYEFWFKKIHTSAVTTEEVSMIKSEFKTKKPFGGLAFD